MSLSLEPGWNMRWIPGSLLGGVGPVFRRFSIVGQLVDEGAVSIDSLGGANFLLMDVNDAMGGRAEEEDEAVLEGKRAPEKPLL